MSFIRILTSSRGVKIHKPRMHKQTVPQNFRGSVAEKSVKMDKVKSLQSERPTVYCGEKCLENVFKFKYLGSFFAADDDQSHERISMTQQRFGSLRNVFSSSDLT